VLQTRLVAIGVALLTALVLAPAPAAEAAPTIRFTRIYFDSPGADRGGNSSLNAEWIRVKNAGKKARVLTGWTVRDASGHVFRFPTFKLRAGASVTIHTGRGTNTAGHLYWRSSWYVWNNTGDSATLRNRSGARIDVCKYSGKGSATYC
jgi:hypothetical protein